MVSQNKIELDVELKIKEAQKALEKLDKDIEKTQTKLSKLNPMQAGVFAKGGGTVGSGLKGDIDASFAKKAAIVDTLNASIQQAARSTGAFGKAWGEFADGFEKRLTIFASYRIISEVVNVLTESVAGLVRLQTEFANIQAIAAVSDTTMESLKNTIFEVGNSTRFTNEELAKTTVILAQAGLSASQIGEALPAVTRLASATGTDLATSVNVATSALTIWNMEASQASYVANVLTESVNRTKAEIATIANGLQYAGVAAADLGMSFEETISIMTAVTNAGLKQRAVVGTGTRALLAELAKPTENLKKGLKDVGLSLDDVDVQSKGLTKVLKNLDEAGFGASNAFQSLERRAATFYLAARSQLPLIGTLRQSFVDSAASIQANDTQMNTLSGQWTRFKNIIQDLSNTAFTPLLDVLTGLLKVLNAMIGTVADVIKWLKEFSPVTFSLVQNLLSLGLAATLGSKALGSMRDYINIAKTGMKALLATILATNVAINASTVATSKLGKAMVFLKTTFSAIGKSTAGLLIITAIVAGLKTLYDWATVTGGSLEKITEKIGEKKESLGSLNAAYDELTTKQELYSTDSDALSVRIMELNTQFRESNGLLLTQADNYEMVLKKIREMVFLREKEIGEKQIESAGARKTEAKEELLSAAPIYGAVTEAGRKRIVLADQMMKKIDASTEAQFKELSDEIDRIDDKTSRESIRKYLTQHMVSLNEKAEGMAKLSSAAVGEEVGKFYDDVKAEADKISEAYKTTTDNLLNKAGTLDVSAVFNNINTSVDKLNAELTKIEKELDKLYEADPSLKERPTEVVTHLKNLQNIIGAQIVKISKGYDEELKKYLEENEKYVDEIVKYTVRASKLGTLPEDELLKMLTTARELIVKSVEEERLKLLQELTQDIENTRKTRLQALGKEIKDTTSPEYQARAEAIKTEVTPRQRERETTINLKAQTELSTNVAELDQQTYNLTHNFDRFNNTIRRTEKTMQDLEVSAKAAVDAQSQNLFQMQGRAEGLAAAGFGDTPEATVLNAQIAAEQLRIDAARLQANEELVEKYKAQRGEVSGIIGNLQGELKIQEAIKNKAGEAQETQETAKKRAEQVQSDLNKAISTQSGFTDKILALEKDITTEKAKQKALIEARTPKPLDAGGAVKTGVAAFVDKDLKDSVIDLNQALSQTTQEGLSSFTEGFTMMVSEVARGNQSLKDAFKDMITSVLTDMADFVTQMTIKYVMLQAMGFMFPGATAIGMGTATVASAGTGAVKTAASGGLITGGVRGKDSVPTMLMPGEYVLKKSAVDVLGKDFMHSLNSNAGATMSSITPTVGLMGESGDSGGIVNVWVVQDRKDAGMGPQDVIATISRDIQTGGQTRTLIKSVVAGRR